MLEDNHVEFVAVESCVSKYLFKYKSISMKSIHYKYGCQLTSPSKLYSFRNCFYLIGAILHLRNSLEFGTPAAKSTPEIALK